MRAGPECRTEALVSLSVPRLAHTLPARLPVHARLLPQTGRPAATDAATRSLRARCRRVLLSLAALVALVTPACVPAVAPMPPVTVDVQHDGDVYVVVAALFAPVAPAAAWAVLTDFDHMSDFMPSLTASRVLKRVDNSVLVQQSGKTQLGTFRMPFESFREIDLAPPTIRSRQLRGNMQRVDSTTTFIEVPGGTRIEYRVEIVPKLWMPEKVAGPLLKGEVEKQLDAILNEIARRAMP